MHGFPVPGRCEETAAQAERLGFDGLLLADSQNLVGDVFVELGVLARTTDRLGLGTGVINPVTRHPAVTAAAIASVQLESGGRRFSVWDVATVAGPARSRRAFHGPAGRVRQPGPRVPAR